MTKESLSLITRKLGITTLGLTLVVAASFASAPAFAQSVDTIYMHSGSEIKAGKRALRKGNIDRAIVLFEKGLDKKLPRATRVVGLNDLCIAYRLKGDQEAAKLNCDKAIELNPGYWQAYNNRANIYHDQKNYLAALSDYEAALDINPKADVARQNLRAIKTSISMTD